MLRFDDDEWMKFLVMYEQTDVKAKAVFAKARIFGEPFKVFGESHIDEVAAKYGLKVLGRIPLDPQIASLCDRGVIELFEGDWLDEAADAVEAAKKEAQNS